jgi:hypothetical protein
LPQHFFMCVLCGPQLVHTKFKVQLAVLVAVEIAGSSKSAAQHARNVCIISHQFSVLKYRYNCFRWTAACLAVHQPANRRILRTGEFESQQLQHAANNLIFLTKYTPLSSFLTPIAGLDPSSLRLATLRLHVTVLASSCNRNP